MILSHEEPSVQREWAERINYVITNVSKAAVLAQGTTPMPPLTRPASAAAVLGMRKCACIMQFLHCCMGCRLGCNSYITYHPIFNPCSVKICESIVRVRVRACLRLFAFL